MRTRVRAMGITLALVAATAVGQPRIVAAPAAAAQQNSKEQQTRPVCVAARMPGEDCGAKINAADARLGRAAGIIQVSADCGTVLTTPVRLSPGHSLQFVHGGTYVLNAPIRVGANGSLCGLPMASDDAPLRLVEGDGANLPFLVSLAGHATIRDILLDGNRPENPGALDVLLVQDANRVHIDNVTIRNATRDDLHVSSRAEKPNTSGDGYLGPNVLLQHAGRDAMFIERCADWIVGPQVEFESAGRDGLHGEDSPTLRCSNCDFGVNVRYGASTTTVGIPGTNLQASGWIIVGCQFGNNKQGDFYANGSAKAKALNGVHTLTGNAFIQLHSAPNTYNSITLIDAGGNTISGNTWGFVQPSWAFSYKYIIAATFPVLRGREKYPSVISGNNILPGTYGTAAFSVDPQDVVSGNSP